MGRRLVRTRTPMRFGYLVFVLSVSLLGSACGPMPTKETAVVHAEAFIHPPILGLDFWSTELYIVEVDGKPQYLPQFYNAELAPGRHSITVEVRKGPTGILGVAPLLGICRGQLEIDAEAGKTYIVEFKRESQSELLRGLDKTTGAVLFNAPCIPRQVSK